MPCLALVALAIALGLFVLLLRPDPDPDPDPDDPRPLPPQSLPRHVSFSPDASSSPFHKRRFSAPPPPPIPPLSTRRRSSSSSTLIHLGHTATSPPSQRTRFAIPFTKSRTPSPPSYTTLKSPFTARRTMVSKFKSIFKSTSSPIIQSRPLLKSINAKLRRKPVARTQPYGPPWNAPMPVPDLTLSPAHKPSLSSPRTFINQLDEKLSLLQQQRVKDLISP